MFEEQIDFYNPVTKKSVSIKDIILKIVDNGKEIILTMVNVFIKTEVILIFAATLVLLSVIFSLVYYNTCENVAAYKNLQESKSVIVEENTKLKEQIQTEKENYKKALEEEKNKFQQNYNYQSTQCQAEAEKNRVQHKEEIEKLNATLSKHKELFFEQQAGKK